jgi:hypothetical protein
VWWHTPVIPPTREVEIRKMSVGDQEGRSQESGEETVVVTQADMMVA